jgi:hypothetical protein
MMLLSFINVADRGTTTITTTTITTVARQVDFSHRLLKIKH